MSGAAQYLLEEVTVTAQKRQQNLQDAGIAIPVLSGDQARALGVEQSLDSAGFTPGVHIGGNIAGGDATSFTREFRLNGETERTRWVAGAFYLNIETLTLTAGTQGFDLASLYRCNEIACREPRLYSVALRHGF